MLRLRAEGSFSNRRMKRAEVGGRMHVGDVWSWLDENRNQIGALSSVAFGLSSALVAWLAYRVNRVNSVGLPPVLLVLRMVGDRKDIVNRNGTAIVVWNRRMYPIVLTSVRVQFSSTTSGV